MATAKNRSNINTFDDIYEDLKNRLSNAKKGEGLKFSELPSESLIEYLKNVGIPVNQLENAVSFLNDKFKGIKKKVVETQEEHHFSEPIIHMGEHPFVETKHKPRKTVFGQIVKITK
jgi:hypothetical protein